MIGDGRIGGWGKRREKREWSGGGREMEGRGGRGCEGGKGGNGSGPDQVREEIDTLQSSVCWCLFVDR